MRYPSFLFTDHFEKTQQQKCRRTAPGMAETQTERTTVKNVDITAVFTFAIDFKKRLLCPISAYLPRSGTSHQ